MSLKEDLIKAKEKLLGKINRANTNLDQSEFGNGNYTSDYTPEQVKSVMDHYTKGDMSGDIELLRSLSDVAENPSPPRARVRHFSKKNSILLDDKVDNFIDWYFKNRVKDNYDKVDEYRKPSEMRNFIEKMAVWYELRYPDYEINKIYGSGAGNVNVSEVMFNSNKYIDALFDEDSDVRELDWDEFYNTSAFINALPWNELGLLQRPSYRGLVYAEPHKGRAHLHLSRNGNVQESEGFGVYSGFKVSDAELKGKNIEEVVQILKDEGVELPKDNELESLITFVDNWKKQKEGMLDCVMYRILERGGERMGPRRALLFAREFERDIDIPMMYGVDFSDPGLRSFVNEYIKAGGSKDLNCYVGYFSRESKNEKLDTVSVQELVNSVRNDCATKYTPEETALHQRLVNALDSQVDHDAVRQDEVKKLRLQRRLDKSKNVKK